MKIDVTLLKVTGNKVEEVASSSFDKEYYEKNVEDWIEKDPEIILGEKMIIIDRQPATSEGEKPDLLAVDSEGGLVIIEVKNERAKREIIGQVFDYASQLTEADLEEVASKYGRDLRQEFKETFGEHEEVNFNMKQRIMIVAPELDPALPRIINFLTSYEVDIQAVTLGFHKDGASEYITRGVVRPERTGPKYNESIEAYFKDKRYSDVLEKIKSFFEQEKCTFKPPRGSEISFFGDHGYRVGLIRKQAKAIAVGIHPCYWKPEDVKRAHGLPQKLCGVFPYRDTRTINNEEIIDWIEFRKIRKFEDFERFTGEIKKAMDSLAEYYHNPPQTKKIPRDEDTK